MFVPPEESSGLMPGKLLNDVRVCGNEQKWSGATCIIDNPHFGRPHWGPDANGVYRQWGIAKEEVNNEEAHRWSDDRRWCRNDPNRRSSR